MNIVRFEVATFEENLDLFSTFLKNPRGRKIVVLHYPELTQQSNLSLYLKRIYENNKDKIKGAKDEVAYKWSKIEKDIITALENIIEKKFDFNAIGKLSLLPIAPRFIKTREFYFYYLSKCKLETIVHELLHFIYFEKWKECFPEYNDETKQIEFESPHLVWHLSEIVPGIILSHKEISSLLDCQPKSYRQYYLTYIGSKSIFDHIKDIYLKYLNKRKFCEFLKEAYNFIIKNKEVFSNLKDW